MNNKYIEELTVKLRKSGVEEDYINKCVQYAHKLMESEMPVIFNGTHLSLLLGIDITDLINFAYCDRALVYNTISIPKKAGGQRELNAPCLVLKYIQRWILDNILINMHVSKYCTGFQRKTSILTNANYHLNKNCIINLDIKDFFPSILSRDVYRLFRYYGYSVEVSNLLSRLCTYNEALPQGSPASPMLSNVRCLKMDKRLGLLAEQYGATYSRYADDITLSSDNDIAEIVLIAEKIINDEGFTINNKKTRVLYSHQKQEVTGLIVNNDKPSVPRAYKRALMQEIYYCKKYGPTDHQRFIGDDHAFFKEHLYGKAYFIKMVEPEIGVKLLEELDSIDWND